LYSSYIVTLRTKINVEQSDQPMQLQLLTVIILANDFFLNYENNKQIFENEGRHSVNKNPNH